MIKRLYVVLCIALAGILPGCTPDVEPVWHDEEGFRWAPLSVSGKGAGFTQLPPRQTGIKFTNQLNEQSLLANRHTMNGSGVAIGDVDGDGWPDLYFTRLDGPNALYRNLGNWQFEEITTAAGVAAGNRYSTGAVLADIDGDLDLDLLVTAMGGPNATFLNDGTGRFTDVTETSGLASRSGSTTMALADIDSDGDLDLYVANYKTKSVNDIYAPHERLFEQTIIRDGDTFHIAPEFEEHYDLSIQYENLIRFESAEPDQIYLNDGAGHFAPLSFTDGAFLDVDGSPLENVPAYWALTARFQDFNGDGVPDLYVCNDFESPDLFWLGDGAGHFQALDNLALRKTSFSTMSIDASDVDRDGDLDLFTTDMLSRDYTRRHTQLGLSLPMSKKAGEINNRPQAVQNMLFLSRHDGSYAEVASMAGLAASEWSWSGLFLDVDLDGYEDLLITTGHSFDVQDADAQIEEMQKLALVRNLEQFQKLILDFPPLHLPNIAFRNTGDGSFEFIPDGWGFGAKPDLSHGLAFGDLDRDGDIDMVSNRLNDTAGIYQNNASAPRLLIRLKGRPLNTQGIGSTIRVSNKKSGNAGIQTKEVISGGQYLSGSDPVYSFAAQSDSMQIVVQWRSGLKSTIEGVHPNRVYEISEPEETASTIVSIEEGIEQEPYFKESLFDHLHKESSFDDFSRQPLLPWSLSRLGPAVAFADLDADGNDDLLVGSGQGAPLSAYLNRDGRFISTTVLPPEKMPRGDLAGIVTLPQADGSSLVFVGASNYEGTPRNASWIDIYKSDRAGRLTPVDRLPFGAGSIGPLALADVDGDGDVDLFAGGRVLPGRYPESTSSRIYLNESSQFTYNPDLSIPFAEVGMVSGAAFGDLDHDGDADVLMAIEWGPLRYFDNDGTGHFSERTEEVGLNKHTGRWNGITLGDFDADGNLDAVATNWGWNTHHGRVDGRSEPIRLYYSDFDANGVVDPIEAHYEISYNGYMPDRGLDALSAALPYVRERTPTHHHFAEAILSSIVGPKIDRAPYLEAKTLSHVTLLNRPDEHNLLGFEVLDLPAQAQAAPAFAVIVADYDGDGNEDIFLGQNAFALPNNRPRLDAGRGLWLHGNGTGTFNEPVYSNMGIKVYGEQRGAAVADINKDGRVDLVVSQNGAWTKLYQNQLAEPGLRARLGGPPNNPAGIGATVRIRYKDGSLGPARLVTAGSGYWSQSSVVQVLGFAIKHTPTHIVAQWSDGTTTEMPISKEDIELLLSH